jgi:hypothetical protein
MIVNTYEENGVIVTTYSSGAIVKTVKSVQPPIFPQPEKTVQERLDDIETTQDIILLKLEGVIA